MKKFMYICALAALATGCTETDIDNGISSQPESVGFRTLKVSTEASDELTRATWGDEVKFQWEMGDAELLGFVTDSENDTANHHSSALEFGETAANGIFTLSVPENASKLFTYYPYKDGAVSGDSSGYTITFTVPSEQTQTAAGKFSFANASLAANYCVNVAEGERTVRNSMKLLSPLVKFLVYDSTGTYANEKVQSVAIVIPTLIGGVMTYTVNFDGEDKLTPTTNLGARFNTVTLEQPFALAGAVSKETSKGIYMAILPSTAAANTITYTVTTDEATYQFTSEEEIEFKENMVYSLPLNLSRCDNRVDLNEAYGIKLPYIISLLTSNTINKNTKYGNFIGDGSTEGGSDMASFAANDESGATVSGVLSSKKLFSHWYDASGHSNLYFSDFDNWQSTYMLITLPLKETLRADESLRVSFGYAGANYNPAHMELLYSTDNENYTSTGFIATVEYGLPVGSSKNFFYYQCDFTPEETINAGKTLYFKLAPADNLAIIGDNKVIGTNNKARLHSCFVIEKTPKFDTATPAGNVVFFEPFDNCTEGLDYLYGDKLAGMANYCGPELANWETNTNNLTGENVYQRPGYAQISCVETQKTAPTARANTLGYLNTPAFGEAGTLNLSFKAMAYIQKGSFTETTKDVKGDKTEAVVKVVGGGTINGETEYTITGLSYEEFKEYNLTIDDATAETSLQFTSAPASGEFSRWFIDDICVTK